MMRNHKVKIFLFLLILLGGIFRFYNLNWGHPFYFHPDERNIAASVLQLNFPNQMNPHFFAYGSFPIYLIYFTGIILNLFFKSQDLFIQAILISRFYSAILSLLLIPSIYFIGKKLFDKKIAIYAAILSTLSIGFIQFSHFGTFEMWLTFLGLWFFYFSLKLIKDSNSKNTITIGIIFGLLIATKVSSLPLLIIPIMVIYLHVISKKNAIFKLSSILYVSLIVFTITSPYVLFDYSSFISSLKYEYSVVAGTLPVFYTGEFFNSIPIIFQFTKIYPFLINPILTIIFIPSFFYLNFKVIKTKNLQSLLLIVFYLILFLPQAFLFAKWTRYMLPTLPFMYLMLAIFFDKFINKKILNAIILISIVFTLAYFITAFVKQDTRIDASLRVKENIPPNSKVLSEVYDMGIVPFNRYLLNISLFNFYDLDQIPQIKSLELKEFLKKGEYIILPSPRILKTRLTNKNKFPNGYKFYSELISGRLGYEKVYETSCDIFCKISYLGDPIFSFEQTANVFDRPTIFIFKKI